MFKNDYSLLVIFLFLVIICVVIALFIVNKNVHKLKTVAMNIAGGASSSYINYHNDDEKIGSSYGDYDDHVDDQYDDHIDDQYEKIGSVQDALSNDMLSHIGENALKTETANTIFDESYQLTESQRGKFYEPPTSNKQIGQILKFGNLQKYYALSMRISNAVVEKLMSNGNERKKDVQNKAPAIVYELLSEYTTDDDLYQKIAKLAKNDKNFDNDVEEARSQAYGAQIAKRLLDLQKSGKINISPEKTRLLDIGCGSCKIAEHLGGALRLTTQPEGCDLREWSSYNINTRNKNIKFKEIEPEGPLPYEDSSFDIICLNMVLHHMKDPIGRLKEIVRLLAPGGIIFLREHQINDDFDRMLIDIDHLLYMYKRDTTVGSKEVANYFGSYFAAKELDMMMLEVGMKLVSFGEYLMNYNVNIQFNKSIYCVYKKQN